jgi:hypothetical protein
MWLLHKNNQVAFQTMQGVGLADVLDLAEWFSQEGEDLWKAAWLYRMCALKWPNAARKSKVAYLRQCLAALAQIESGTQTGQLDVEFEVREALARFSDRVLEKEQSVDWILALSADKEAASQLNKNFTARMLTNSGMILAGIVNSKYCVAPSLEQHKRASGMLISFSVECTTVLPGESGFAKWYRTYVSSFNAHCGLSICYTLPQRLNESSNAILGEGGNKVVSARLDYSFEQLHQQMVARSGYDTFISVFNDLILMVRFADMLQMAAAAEDWEAACAKVQAPDATLYQVSYVWPLLESQLFSRILTMRIMSWANATITVQAAPVVLWGWTREEDGDFVADFASVRNYNFMAKALIIAKMPATVQQAEASGFLPQPGTW